MNLSALDLIILVPIAFGVIKGFMKGFIREIAAILGLFIGLIAAYLLAEHVFQYFTIYFEAAEFELKIISYVVVFFATILLVNTLASLLTRTLKLIALNGINRLIGAVFGGLKWVFILTVAVFLLNRVQENRTIFQKSTLNSSKFYKQLSGYGKQLAEWSNLDGLMDQQYLIKDGGTVKKSNPE